MVVDVMLRSLWVLNLSLGYFDNVNGLGLTGTLAVIEFLRRGMWNFFRLENEHLNNCGEYRAVRTCRGRGALGRGTFRKSPAFIFFPLPS